MGQFGPGVVGWSGLSQEGCCPVDGGEVSRKRFTRLPSMFFSAAPIDARFDLGIRCTQYGPYGTGYEKQYLKSGYIQMSVCLFMCMQIGENIKILTVSLINHWHYLFSEDCWSCCALSGAGRASRHF